MARNRREDLKHDLDNALESALDQLQSIWTEIGIVDDQRKARMDVVLVHLRNLLDEMVKEEGALRTRLIQNTDAYMKDLLKISNEMGLPPYEPDEGLTLLQLDKDLRNKLNKLEMEKHERLKKVKTLKDQDQHLCDVMCVTPYYIPSGTVPTKEQVQELQQHIANLESEKSHRTIVFKSTKENILKMLDDLEQCPKTSFEMDIVCEEQDSFLLSSDNMKALKEYHDQLEVRQKENFAMASTLRDRITTLWDRLQVTPEERNKFNAQNTGFKQHVIHAMQEEVSRCELLKLKNMKQVILATRNELQDWWDRCYFSRAQRERFTLFTADSYTEGILEAHDQEVQRLKQHYESHKEIFTLVARRQQLWKEFLEFERKATDPNRFFNRGCNLLKEEAARKKLVKELPKVEDQVRELLDEWEQENGSPFLVNGVCFADFIVQQKEQYKSDKENEKVQRNKAKAKEMEEEMRYGSRPKTPSKRPALTPSKTPNKFRKMNETGSRTPGHSRTLRSNYTGVYSPVCMAPRSATKLKTPRATRGDTGTTLLSDKNSSNDTVFSHTTVSSGGSQAQSIKSSSSGAEVDPSGDISTVSMCSIGAYHEFAVGLNQNARPNCRSSVMPSAKTKSKGSGAYF